MLVMTGLDERDDPVCIISKTVVRIRVGDKEESCVAITPQMADGEGDFSALRCVMKILDQRCYARLCNPYTFTNAIKCALDKRERLDLICKIFPTEDPAESLNWEKSFITGLCRVKREYLGFLSYCCKLNFNICELSDACEFYTYKDDIVAI